MPDRSQDLSDKRATLARIAASLDVDTLVITQPATLTWLLGARVNVPQTLDSACLDVVVDVTGGAGPTAALTVVTNAIEAPRLRDTELADLDTGWRVLPWWQARSEGLPRGDRVAVDRDVPALAAALAVARRHLTAREQGRLREVARDTAAAATDAVARVDPSTTEYGAAGAFADELLQRGLDPVVLLVAGEGRIADHRHPLPLDRPVGGRAMLVACGRRHGLVASVTRIVDFRPPPPDTDTYQRLLEVERVFLDASVVGARIGDVAASGVAAYATQRFDPEEWHRHHQGGLSGWMPREYPAHPGSDDVLEAGHVVAWNPSGGGWKVEDTTLVTPAGPEPLVHDDRWPTLEVGGRRRPDILRP